MDSNASDSRRKRLLTAAAIVALLAVSAGVFGGMYVLARKGAFDSLLGLTPTPFVVAPTRTATATLAPTLPSPLLETATSTAVVASTLTPRSTTPTQPITMAPTGTADLLATDTPEPTPSPTVTATADPGVGTFLVEYRGCDPRGSDIGIVKGQIFDRDGKVIAGAEVRVQLDGWDYDQPAISNGEGWYEFYLQKGLQVKIVSLRIEGKEMALAGNEDQVFLAQIGCFEHVNLRQQ